MTEIGIYAYNWLIEEAGGIFIPAKGPGRQKIGFVNDEGNIYKNGNKIGYVTSNGGIYDNTDACIAYVTNEGRICNNSKEEVGYIDQQGSVYNSENELRGVVHLVAQPQRKETIQISILAAAGVFVLVFQNHIQG